MIEKNFENFFAFMDGNIFQKMGSIKVYTSFTRGEIVWKRSSLFIVIFIGADKTAGLIRIPLDVWRS